MTNPQNLTPEELKIAFLKARFGYECRPYSWLDGALTKLFAVYTKEGTCFKPCLTEELAWQAIALLSPQTATPVTNGETRTATRGEINATDRR